MSDSQPVFEPLDQDAQPSRSTSVRPLAKLLTTPIPIWTIAPDGNLAFLSASCGEWLGIHPQQLLGRPTRSDSVDPIDALARSLAPPRNGWKGLLVANLQPSAVPGEAKLPAPRSVTFIRIPGQPLADPGDPPTTVLAIAERLVDPEGPASSPRVAAVVETMLRQLAWDPRRLHTPVVLGASTVIAKLEEQLRISGNASHHVLLSGPRGSGGAALARWMVATGGNSADAYEPPISVDGALMDAELFDASTGIMLGRLMESSQSIATLIVENIDQMPSDAQERLELLLNNYPNRLRVYCTSSLAGNQLHGNLRSSLFIPFTAVEVAIPPLCDRCEDVPLIATALLHRRFQANETTAEQIGREALDRLVNYPWPGNFEELDATIRSAAAQCRGATIRIEHLPLAVRTHGNPTQSPPKSVDPKRTVRPLEEVLAEAEKKHILRALESTEGNRAAAARALEISRPKLLRRIDQLGIQWPPHA